jgi:hypothetical protein
VLALYCVIDGRRRNRRTFLERLGAPVERIARESIGCGIKRAFGVKDFHVVFAEAKGPTSKFTRGPPSVNEPSKIIMVCKDLKSITLDKGSKVFSGPNDS